MKLKKKINHSTLAKNCKEYSIVTFFNIKLVSVDFQILWLNIIVMDTSEVILCTACFFKVKVTEDILMCSGCKLWQHRACASGMIFK